MTTCATHEAEVIEAGRRIVELEARVKQLADALEDAFREEESAASATGIYVETPWMHRARFALLAAGRKP